MNILFLPKMVGLLFSSSDWLPWLFWRWITFLFTWIFNLFRLIGKYTDFYGVGKARSTESTHVCLQLVKTQWTRYDIRQWRFYSYIFFSSSSFSKNKLIKKNLWDVYWTSVTQQAFSLGLGLLWWPRWTESLLQGAPFSKVRGRMIRVESNS